MVKSFKLKFCSICKEKYFYYPGLKRAHRTPQHCKKFSSENDMDPQDVPNELKDLTYIEETLIARIHPVLSVYKLKGLQYGYRGNIINFSQDVNEFAKELPHCIDDIQSVITVKFSKGNCEKTTDFRVRVSKVRSALLWLKANNPHYKNIEISEKNLDMLPEDDYVYDRIACMSLSVARDGKTEGESENEDDDCDLECSGSDLECEVSDVNSSGVPLLCAPNQNDQINSALKWPSMNSNPVSEQLPGLFACAFPTLFPYGNCDFREDREKKVHLHEYIKHLLCYSDDRFANHKTFRFFAFNLWMRHTALTQGNLFVKKDDELAKMNVEQLKERINSSPNLMKKLMFMGSSIRGSKSYWKSRCGELQDMVEQLGLPTIFLTLSAADLYWPDLFQLLCGKNIADIRMPERRRLLQENPAIVDMFFQFRIQCFIENVLEPKFGVIDYWYRIEYQHRGSPHLHGLFWLKDAPDVSKYNEANDEEKEKITKFFSDLVTAVDPEPESSVPDKHPREVLFENVENVKTDLAQLLKKVQRHSCSRAYCKRFDKKLQKTVCRFHFPVDLKPCAELKMNEAGSELEFFPERNDTQLNKFNPFIIGTWRGNIDVAPVLSKNAVINYLTKYVSKSEVKSTTLKEICSSVCENLNSSDKAKRAIQSILIKNCVERDISAQEVCHILNGSKLFSAGCRKFVVVYTNDSKWIRLGEGNEGNFVNECVNDSSDLADRLVDDTSSSSRGKSFMEKYSCRPEHLGALSMWNIAKFYNVNTWAKCRKSNIVRIFPRLKLSSDESKNEEYYRQQVLLHVKWNEICDLRVDEETWKDAFVRHGLGENESVHFRLECSSHVDDDHDEDNFDSANQNNEDWMIASRLAPNTFPQGVKLGRREVDIAHDWHANSSKYGDFLHLSNFIENAKESDTELELLDNLPDVNFTEQQNAVKACIENQINSIQQGNEPLVKRVLVQGKAGTGKSLLIKFITDKLSKEFGSDSYLLMGPTRVSAINIGGATIHSALHINPKVQDYQELRGEVAKSFCDSLSNTKFIIIDEYSMIPCMLLALIDKRLREGMGVNELFGNLCVYFFGDFKQLPPVFGPALYGGVCKTDLDVHGRNVFNSFESFFVLKHVHRQKIISFWEF